MTLTTVNIDLDVLEEIISILAKNGRADLINFLQDSEYKPPKKIVKDILSDTEGSAEEEEGYEVYIDSHGFHSIA
tara:strand:+ start:93 stop:317 length:225 start_codon:yes stop_codon:yes gene_type:complete